jgi:anti-sigma regulatory factor (Ser/Thr protein kinase)
MKKKRTTKRSPPDVQFEFDHDLSAPRGARQKLARWFKDPSDPIADDVELAASELVSNVVLHTDDGGTMKAWDPKPDVPLRLEVEDHDMRVPSSNGLPPATDAGGRGLAIVDTVAGAWGVDRTPSGKIVWAEFTRPDPKSEPETDPQTETRT